MNNPLQQPVSKFMTRKVITVKPSTPVHELFKTFEAKGIVGAPVVDPETNVVGMVTESDLIRHFTTLEMPRGITVLGSLLFLDNLEAFNQHLREHCAETVEGLMITPVITIQETAPLIEALNLMSERRINRLPVTDKAGKLVGLLTRTNVIQALVQLS